MIGSCVLCPSCFESASFNVFSNPDPARNLSANMHQGSEYLNADPGPVSLRNKPNTVGIEVPVPKEFSVPGTKRDDGLILYKI
jgi:hypothetical protein